MSNTVGSKGRVTAIEAGSAVIQARLGSILKTQNIEVSNASLSSVSTSPAYIMLPKNSSLGLTALGTFSDNSILDITTQVTWSSSSETAIVIDNAGQAQIVYSGSNATPVTLSAQRGALSGSTKVIITPSTLTSLTVSPSSWSSTPYTSKNFKVYGRYSDGGLSDLTSMAQWSVADSSTAVVSNFAQTRGRTTLIEEGSTTVATQFASISTSASVAVSLTNPTTLVEPGLGLKGEYFNSSNFSNKTGERIDAQIAFNWSLGGAPMGVSDNFTIRWTGSLEAPNTESLRLCTRSDDGVRVYFNSTLVINNWTDHAVTENCSAFVPVTEDTRYPIQVDFYEKGGYAVIELYWESASVTKTLVPQSALRP